MKVALYIRVSTREQADEGFSLAAQERALRARCAETGDEVVSVYEDRGISAKDIKHRQGLLRLLEDAEQKQFEAVMVWKLTRLSRSLQDMCNIFALFDAKNIALVSLSESFDARSPSGRMVRNMLGVIAQWEREVISENVSLAAAERAEQGLRTCPYALGYDVVIGGDLIVNEKEAKIVRYIFRKYIQCQCISEVAACCNRLGYRGKRGAKFSPESIHRILTRPIYCGYYSFHSDIYRGCFEPIISPKTFNKAQHIMMARGEKYGRNRVHSLRILNE